MAKTTKYFRNAQQLATWLDGEMLPSGVLAVVLNETGEDVEKVAFGTNDITGKYETSEVEKSTTQPLQAVGYMLGNYLDMPMFDIGSEKEYPCDFLDITSIDGITTYKGYIYIKYNRAMTDEESIAEITKITGDVLKNVRRLPGKDNILEIIWGAKDEDITSDILINYDGSTICSFYNELYTQYCNTGIIMMGSTSPITAQTWKSNVEANNIIMDNECASRYHIGATGEYHIMIMAKNYLRNNLPIKIFFNNGQTTVSQYTFTTADKTFMNNGLHAYVFDFKDVTSPSTVNNVKLYWGNSVYKMNFV